MVEIEALARTRLTHMADEDFDALERDLRAIVVRRLATPAAATITAAF